MPNNNGHWVRASTSNTLHAIAGNMARQRREGQELSEAQERLWDRIIHELELRHRSRAYSTCWCDFCAPIAVEPIDVEDCPF